MFFYLNSVLELREQCNVQINVYSCNMLYDSFSNPMSGKKPMAVGHSIRVCLYVYMVQGQRSSSLARIIDIFCEIKGIIAVTGEPVIVRLDCKATGCSLLQLSNRL